MTEKDKQIIKAIKAGVDVRRISKETGIAERTLWNWIKTKPDYEMAYNYRKAFIDNIFSS